jgi:hypothetical protein
MIALNASFVVVRPIGLGTSDVESIISYLSRLSSANRVPLSLLTEYVSDTSAMPFPKDARGRISNYWLSKLLNGDGAQVGCFLDRLSELTGGNALEKLTLRGWSHIFKGTMINGFRRFDPRGDLSYQKLIHCISAVSVAADGWSLESNCHSPDCGELMPVAQFTGALNHCSKCGAKLSKYSAGIRVYQPDIEFRKFVTKGVEEIVAFSESTQGFVFSEAFSRIFTLVNFSSRKDGAKYFGLTDKMIKGYLTSESDIGLFDFMRILWKLEVGPVEFFRQSFFPIFDALYLGLSNSISQDGKSKASTGSFPLDQIARKLRVDMLKDEYTRMPFRRYCQMELGRSYEKVKSTEPFLCDEFITLLADRRKCRGDSEQFGRMAEVCYAARTCEIKGKVANSRNLTKYMKKPGFLREDWAGELIRSIILVGARETMNQICAERALVQ